MSMDIKKMKAIIMKIMNMMSIGNIIILIITMEKIIKHLKKIISTNIMARRMKIIIRNTNTKIRK